MPRKEELSGSEESDNELGFYGDEPSDDEDAVPAVDQRKRKMAIGFALVVFFVVFIGGGVYMATDTSAKYADYVSWDERQGQAAQKHESAAGQALMEHLVNFEDGEDLNDPDKEHGLLDFNHEKEGAKPNYAVKPPPGPAQVKPAIKPGKPKPEPSKQQMLSREQWERKIEHEKVEARKKMEAHDRNQQVMDMVKAGDWYWGAARGNRRAGNQCFYNSTVRREDYWVPLSGYWKRQKNPIPIYGHQHAHVTPSANCFGSVQVNYEKGKSGKHIKKKKGKMVFTTQHHAHCGDQGYKNARVRYVADKCGLRTLWDATVLKMLQGHRVWFIGDYIMQQQYEHLKCVMSVFASRGGTLGAGKITGTQGQYVNMKGTRLAYLYAGLQEDPNRVQTDTAAEYKVEGLGAELRGEFGLDQVKGIDAKTKHETAQVYKSVELADILTERMDEFLAGDVIVAGFGNDYDEPRVYQATLLKFLQLYEDMNDQLPVVLWRETPAQHHLGYEAGDILVPLQTTEHAMAVLKGPAAPAFAKPGTGFGNEMDAPNLAPKEMRTWRATNVQCGEISIEEFEEHNWRNKLANRLVEAAGIPIMRIWKATTQQNDWYSGKCGGGLCDRWGPCMHYCKTAGALTYFNELLMTIMDSQPLQETFLARENMTYVEEEGITSNRRRLHRRRLGDGGRPAAAGYDAAAEAEEAHGARRRWGGEDAQLGAHLARGVMPAAAAGGGGTEGLGHIIDLVQRAPLGSPCPVCAAGKQAAAGEADAEGAQEEEEGAEGKEEAVGEGVGGGEGKEGGAEVGNATPIVIA